MCANIKALPRDIEDSFNAGYLCQYSDTGNKLLNSYYWTKTLKTVVTPFSHVCVHAHVCMICSDWLEQGEDY